MTHPRARIAAISTLGSKKVQSVEDGCATYLLGRRDSKAGVLPPVVTNPNDN